MAAQWRPGGTHRVHANHQNPANHKPVGPEQTLRMAPRKRHPLDSPRSPRSETLQGTAEVTLQLKQFLDEWYYRILHSSLAKEMNRWEALRALLDVLEMVGVRFSEGEKDAIAALRDEEAAIDRIVRCMPQGLREQWEHVCLQLQTVVYATTRVRKAAEVKGDGADETISDVFEDATDEGMIQQILKGAVVFSSKNVANLRNIHVTWRKNTDARIDRMARLHAQAEGTTQHLLALEAQLADLGLTQKNKGKQMLMSMADNQDRALLHSILTSWRGLSLNMQVEQNIRKKFEDRIYNAENKLLEYKAKQIANVRGVMMRLAGEEDAALLRDSWTLWTAEVQRSKDLQRGDDAELKRVQDQLAELQRSTVESAKRVMTRLNGNNATAVVQLHWQAWIDFIRLGKQEREMQKAARNTELALKKQMEAKKKEARGILDKIAGGTDTGLKAVVMQHWIEFMHEEKNSRAMDDALYGQETKFKLLAKRHRAGAMSAQTAMNYHVNLCMKQLIFSNWKLEMKVNGINHAFVTKYASKKRQLQGVQNLFRSFAVQLEQNLGGDEDEQYTGRGVLRSEAGSKSSAPPSSKRSGKRGMARDNMGASSLPDIHSRAYLA